MKWRFCVAVTFSAILPLVEAEEARFTSTVSQEELTAAGLAGLTPAQRVRLDALVEAYKSGTITQARRAAEDAVVAKEAAEEPAALAAKVAEAARLQAARAETSRIAASPVEAKTAAESPGWLAKAKSD